MDLEFVLDHDGCVLKAFMYCFDLSFIPPRLLTKYKNAIQYNILKQYRTYNPKPKTQWKEIKKNGKTYPLFTRGSL